jgi:N-acetylated-alpha-linked acidic dipeptidase
VICSWDGEEVGLTGSTEWGEQFADELRKKAVAYINVDSSTSGPNLEGSAVASLAPMLVETTRTLQDPAGKTLYEAWKESETRAKSESKEHKEVTDYTLADTRIGSGSDHTVFLNFIGMPVIGLGFEGPYGVYHSMYDDFYWMNHFGDPGYRYHTLMSQLWGVLALRLANADLLPFDFANYANNIHDFVNDLSAGKDLRELDLASLQASIKQFGDAGQRLDHRLSSQLAAGTLSAKAKGFRESGDDAGGTKLAESQRHSRQAVVQAHALRSALHLRAFGASRPNGGGGKAGLANGKAASRIITAVSR